MLTVGLKVCSLLLWQHRKATWRNRWDATYWDKDAQTAWGHHAESRSGGLKSESYSEWQHTETRTRINMQLVLGSPDLGLLYLLQKPQFPKGESSERRPSAMLKLLHQGSQTQNFILLHDSSTSKRDRKYKSHFSCTNSYISVIAGFASRKKTDSNDVKKQVWIPALRQIALGKLLHPSKVQSLIRKVRTTELVPWHILRTPQKDNESLK